MLYFFSIVSCTTESVVLQLYAQTIAPTKWIIHQSQIQKDREIESSLHLFDQRSSGACLFCQNYCNAWHFPIFTNIPCLWLIVYFHKSNTYTSFYSKSVRRISWKNPGTQQNITYSIVFFLPLQATSLISRDMLSFHCCYQGSLLRKNSTN